MKNNLLSKFSIIALGAVVLLNLVPTVLVSAQSNSAPYATTESHSNLTQSSVTLNGLVNPNGSSTTAWFEYGISSNSLNQRSSDFSIGNANYQTSISSGIFNLNVNSTYYYKMVARNAYGTNQGNLFSFSTGSTSGSYTPSTGNFPLVTTNSANLISSNGVTFYGSVNPNNAYTTTWFEYGPTTSLGNISQNQVINSGSSYVTTSASVFNLNANTTYYYRVVAQNYFGNAYGSVRNIYVSNNTAVVANNQDLNGLSNTLSQLDSALSGLVKTVANRPATDTQTIVERVVQVSSAGNGLAKLTLVADRPALKSGDAVVITAEINALADISKASLQINLDPSLVFDSSVASVFNKNGNIITYTLGNIAAKDVQVVKLNAHLSKDADISKIAKVTTIGVLNYSDSTGAAMTPLFASLDANVGSPSLFASVFGAFSWGSGLAIFLIVLLILLVVVAVKKLTS